MNDHTDFRIPILLAVPLCFLLFWAARDNGFLSQPERSASSPPNLEIMFGPGGSAADEALRSVFQLRKIPVNTADSDLLQSISGIGPHLAEKIIAERNGSGPFTSAEELCRVEGIGPKRLSKFKQHLRFD